MSEDMIVLKKWSSIRVWDNRTVFDQKGAKKSDDPQDVVLVGRIVDIRPGEKYVICTLDTGYNVSFKREELPDG